VSLVINLFRKGVQGYWLLVMGYSMNGAGFWVLDTGFWILDTGETTLIGVMNPLSVHSLPSLMIEFSRLFSPNLAAFAGRGRSVSRS
jgi:hypothetical protein